MEEEAGMEKSMGAGLGIGVEIGELIWCSLLEPSILSWDLVKVIDLGPSVYLIIGD